MSSRVVHPPRDLDCGSSRQTLYLFKPSTVVSLFTKHLQSGVPHFSLLPVVSSDSECLSSTFSFLRDFLYLSLSVCLPFGPLALSSLRSPSFTKFILRLQLRQFTTILQFLLFLTLPGNFHRCSSSRHWSLFLSHLPFPKLRSTIYLVKKFNGLREWDYTCIYFTVLKETLIVSE